MKNTTKGALAAATAAVLLMGGAGSLASWSDTETLTGGSVQAGNLSLDAPTCDASWKYAVGKAGNGANVGRFVPGDVVSKSCTFTVNGAGDNLQASLSTPTTVAMTGNNVSATVVTSYKLGAAAMTLPATITSADNAKVVTATFTATFPFGPTVNANNMQNAVASLNNITVNLTQVAPN